MKNVRRWLPGAIVSIVFIALILYYVDLAAVVRAIAHANPALLFFAVITGFIWMMVRAQVWRILLRNRPSYSAVFWTVGEGYLLNNFLPFRLGEVGRAYLISRKSDVTFMEAIPTIIIERAMDLGYSAVILLIALPYVVGAEGSQKIGIFIGAVVLVAFVILYLLARYNQWALNLFHKLSARWPSR